MSDEEPRTRADQKRQRKAEEDRLAQLAKTLVELPKKQLAKLDVPEQVLDAVVEARRIKSHTALARQMRIVRRELRDADNVGLADALARLLDPRAGPAPQVQEAERWVERMLASSDGVEAFLAEYGHADRQQLRGLVRNLVKTAAKAEEEQTPAVKKARKRLRKTIEAYVRDAPTGDGDP